MSTPTTIHTFPTFWNRKTVREHPTALFVFGDNDMGVGCGGQAVIRNEPNAIGLPTKKAPSATKAAYYTDDEYAENCAKVDTAVQAILKEALKNKYRVLVLPAGGFGTGLSKLPEKAPRTYAYVKPKGGGSAWVISGAE